MSTKLESVSIPLAPGTVGSEQPLLAMLDGVWRRRLLVLAIVAVALVLSIIAVAVMPARYRAQAYIRGEFVVSDTLPMQVKNMTTGSMSAGPMNLDPGRVIETQSRLLQSNRLARRVVQQLGLERLQPMLSQRGWLPAIFQGKAAHTPGDMLDIAAARLLNRLSVTSDPRAYLLTVQFTTSDPELSVLITNGFVSELLRSTRLQVLFQQSYNTQATLSNQLAKFGEKHPKVAELRAQLATTNDALKQQLNESPDSILQAAGENVTRAIAAPAGPTPAFLIGLLLFAGLMIGIGVALWVERRRWWPAFS